MSKSISPFIGQWQCDNCRRIFSRYFMRCPYCPTGDLIEDQMRLIARELLAKTHLWTAAQQSQEGLVAAPVRDEAAAVQKRRVMRRRAK